nr:adenylyl-sulfate kinase [Rufibacter tibetensis]
MRLEHYLFHKGYKVFLLDGDNVRNGLNKDLSFSETDRKENLRRVVKLPSLCWIQACWLFVPLSLRMNRNAN